MTRHWRGDPRAETAMQKWLRDRWQYRSVYVLDIDHLICDPSGERGVLIEEKYHGAVDKTPTITLKLARRLGWYGALFVYQTDDRTPTGAVTQIDATLWSPEGKRLERPNMDAAWFDEWVCARFGALMPEQEVAREVPRASRLMAHDPLGRRRNDEEIEELIISTDRLIALSRVMTQNGPRGC